MKTMQPLERASPGTHGCWQKPWLVCNRLWVWAGHTQLHWWCAEFPADRRWGQRADALCSWCQAARLPLCASQHWLPALSWGHPCLIFVNVQHLVYTAKTPRTEEVEVRDTHRDPSELSTSRLSGLNVCPLPLPGRRTISRLLTSFSLVLAPLQTLDNTDVMSSVERTKLTLLFVTIQMRWLLLLLPTLLLWIITASNYWLITGHQMLFIHGYGLIESTQQPIR